MTPIDELTTTIRPYVIFLSENLARLDQPDQERIGRITRRLLESAVAARSPWIIHAIPAVIRTASSDPVASIKLLRACITQEHLFAVGYQTLAVLTHYLKSLTTIDPAFVHDLYIAAFSHRDESDDSTQIADSQIMPLVSNRRQDYDMGLWQLADYYPTFLSTHPAEATDVLLVVFTDYVNRRHRLTHQPVEIDFDGEKTSTVTDFSEIWDHGPGIHDDKPLQMIAAFQSFLEEHAEDEPMLHARLAQVASFRPVAAFWRRLLMAGGNQPATIGHAVRSLTWQHPILIGYDTSRHAGNLLKAIFPELTDVERERVENAILNIPVLEPQDGEAAAHYRDRLLGCLDAGSLTTEAARTVRHQLDSKGGAPANVPAHKFTADVLPFGVEEFLQSEGVVLTAPITQDALAVVKPVSSFAKTYQNVKAPIDAAHAVAPALIASLEEARNPEIHDELRNHILSDCADACEAILKADSISDDSELLSIARSVIEAAAADPYPIPNPERNAAFGESPSWGMPAARLAAARALMFLARQQSVMDDSLRELIKRLSDDPVASVHYQIAGSLNYLYTTAPALMWERLELQASAEPNPGVLRATVAVMQHLAPAAGPRIALLARQIFERVPDDGKGAREVRRSCVNIFAGLAVWQEDTTSVAMIDRFLSAPTAFERELPQLIADIGSWLTAADTSVAERSFAWYQRILAVMNDSSRKIREAQPKRFDEWPDEQRDDYAGLLKGIGEIATRLFFASGAHHAPNAEVKPPDPAFYERALPLLTSLSSIGLPSISHRLLETLNHLMPLDPVRILALVGEVVKAGASFGYQYEPLAEDLIVRIIERYLAEFRPALKEASHSPMVLIGILDVFVKVGWPRAHQLTYRLNDIYR